MARLGVNIEAIAMIRESGVTGADPLTIAILSELGGADGIVCPLREGLSVVSERDLLLLKEVVKTHLNVQIPPEEEMIRKALSVGADMVTLIPGKKPGSTPGGGLDILGQGERLAKTIQDFRSQDVVISVCIEPNIHQVKAAMKIGADYVELHLGMYAAAEDLNERNDQIENLGSVAIAAQKLGLGVSAAHGIDYQNVMAVAGIEALEEINVGHAIVSRALSIGMEAAVRDMVALVH
ncbi:pyridoxine 5'-phosphate synthase [bacterium]|nr:pyridoxine 5'-phosphate synthase [bacterium]